MEKKFVLVKDTQVSPLKSLNESAGKNPKDKYVFQGVFTACSTPDHRIINRNGRCYMEQEVLRHLGYLREQIVQNNGCLLGELDHPEGRFEVHLKEASHKITDLWYDKNTHCVMGKLKLLDTPNGKIARELVDEGYPLYVSSRAAGDVNEKTKEVEIAQIFTYDIVCTPGFEEAKLAEVSESLSAKTLKYINESLSTSNKKSKKKTMINEDELKISDISKFNGTTIDEVSAPLNEDDEVDEETSNESKFLPIMNTNPLKEEDEKEDESEEKDEKDKKDKDSEDEEKKGVEEVSDEEKEKNRELIISIVGIDEDDNIITNDDESEEATEEEENEKKEDIVDIKAEGNDEDEDDEDDEVSEDVVSENDKKEESKVKKSANETVEKKERLKEEVDKDMEELESILDSVKTSESVKESIIRRYPFAISLSESNFAKFASLRPKLKKRCADFIEEHEIFDVKSINELWNSPLLEEKRLHSNFLLLASEYDKELYCAAPVEVQNAIEEAAKYVVLETQEDVDMFWERTGLRQQAAQKVMNERYIAQYQQALSEHKEFQKNNPLGYSVDYISMTEEYFKNN